MAEGEKFRWEPALDPDSIVIPGLNTAAPTADQIEQIDQLITLKLQKIDGQFARIQWLAEHKLLPAVKRYSNGVQPVREAARFWVQFFEMAARMRVPRHDDFEDPEQEEDIAEEEDHESEGGPVPWETSAEHPGVELDQSTSTVTTGTEDIDVFDSTPQPLRSRPHSRSHSRQGLFDPGKTPSESSFLPGGDIVSSTPAAIGKRRAAGLADDGPSWTSSIESSLHRLNEELDMLGMDPNPTPQSQASSASIIDATPTASIHGSTRPKGKGRANLPESPMLRNILTKNANTSTVKKAPPSPILFDVGIPGLSTPLRRDAAKILARMNPYLPSNTKPNDWSSVVDLSVHKLSSPKRQPPVPSSSRLLSEGGGGSNAERRTGYHPSPITIKRFERPNRGPELQQTPRKEAVARIGKDLLWDAGHRQQLFSKHDPSYSHGSSSTGPGWDMYSQRRSVKDSDSTASTIADPPSLSRYVEPSDPDSTARSELDLDSIMRRVGLDLNIKLGDIGTSTTSGGHTTTNPVSTLTKPSVQRTFEPPISDRPAPVFTRALRTPSSERHRRELEQQQQQLYGSIRVGMDNETVIGRGSLEDEDDSFDDDDDQPNNTVNPSAAFLAASQRQGNFDNSFDSNDDSFSGDEVSGEGVAVHPFATFGGGGFDDDDSFDDSTQMDNGGIGGDTETVFGARHAQMPAQGHRQLKMFGEEIAEDSQGFGVTITSQESPTPKWPPSRG
ncbi:hypothetical protein BDM02DRAFT_3185523 [Thelephora ganbajun]|uniref:Uncharacterized protein n=1 Tax=Thelephora ganbajun TaxID=370292 RepID=A0ACB6ZKH4_THEGA|nr:hypothetical protein BDM02DRAFT_3185523 [Thelephora ganbajun]